MKVFHKRALNKHECYVCTEKDIKLYFKDSNTLVGFGSTRTFHFDSNMRKCPQINGVVVLDVMVNNRSANNACIISIYPVNTIPKEDREKFIVKFLPKLYEWYSQYTCIKSGQIQGLNQLVVEYCNNDFTFHKLHCI